jgi:hypothetical protein
VPGGAGGARTHDRRIMRSPGPALRARCLHGYHGAVPPTTLIALFARVSRSTNRSTPRHGDHRIQLQKVTADRQGLMPGLRQAGNVVDLKPRPRRHRISRLSRTAPGPRHQRLANITHHYRRTMVCPERILAMKLGFALPIVGFAVSSAAGLSAFCRGLEVPAGSPVAHRSSARTGTD